MPLVKPRSEIGTSGTNIFGGIIEETDYNTSFHGEALFDTIEEMRNGDATTAIALKGLKLPIKSAQWFLQPASDDESDMKVMEFVKQSLFENPNFTWDHFLDQALNHLDFGHYIFEKVYETVTIEGQAYWGLLKLAPRLPKTIFAWETQDKKPGITQFTVKKGTVNIPREKLVYFQNEMEGDNYRGKSILRAAFPHFYYKTRYYKIDAIATERQGVGVPRARKNNQEGGSNLKDEERDQAVEVMQNMRANEKGYLIEPRGITIDWMDMMADKLKDPEKMIMHHDRQILKSVFLQFLALGEQNSGGSYALSRNHSDLLYLALNAIAENVRDVVQNEIINELVMFNFEGVEPPKLMVEGMGEIDINTFSVGTQRLVQSKMLTPNIELEMHVRKILDLPELSEEQIEQMRKDEEENKQRQREQSSALIESLRNRTKEATNKIVEGYRSSLQNVSDYVTSAIDKIRGK